MRCSAEDWEREALMETEVMEKRTLAAIEGEVLVGMQQMAAAHGLYVLHCPDPSAPCECGGKVKYVRRRNG